MQAKPKVHQIEEVTQANLVRWANLTPTPNATDLEPGSKIGHYLFAIPNGGFRNIRTATRLKAQGVKAGVWDLFFPVARLGYHGLWLEAKANTNPLTDLQTDWGQRTTRAGYATVQFYDWHDAAEALTAYLSNAGDRFAAIKERSCKPLSKRSSTP